MNKKSFKPKKFFIWFPLLIIIPHFLLVSKSIDLSVGLLILLLGLCIPLFIFTQFIHNIEIDSENFYKVHTITKKIVQKIPFSSILNIEIKKDWPS